MEETPTQILKKIKDLERDHNNLKNEIIDEVKNFEEYINKKYENLYSLEEKYVKLIEVLNK